jgi:hypothetical protein
MDQAEFIKYRETERDRIDAEILRMKQSKRSTKYIADHVGVPEHRVRSFWMDVKEERRRKNAEMRRAKKGIPQAVEDMTPEQLAIFVAEEEKAQERRFREICEIQKKGAEEEKAKEAKEIKDGKLRPIFENRVPKTLKLNLGGSRLYTFGLIGDTQFNSKYTQITYLRQFYDLCERREIPDVFHTGDIDEGEQMRVGHQYECYRQGADEHVYEIVERYPRRTGIKTRFITGNHDASIFKRSGTDIGKSIAEKRSDMVYLGRDVAKIEITPNCILELRHPWDGTAYALSYRIQKMIEAMEADSKPNILAIGHYHKLEYLFYRNVHCFQTGCFQSQTPFMRGKSISAHMGGWIITVEVDDAGHVLRIVPEMIPFYKPIVDDFLNP